MLCYPDFVALPDIPREIAALTGNGMTVRYGAVYHAALDGRIPVVRDAGRRYHVERSRLPEIARTLGLTVVADSTSSMHTI